MEDRYLYKAKTTPKEKGEFNNVWVTGNLIVSNGKHYIHPVCNAVNVKNETGRIIVMHEVISDTICQCVGSKDKNGNLIWENDIVRGKMHGNYGYRKLVGVVQYYIDAFKVNVEPNSFSGVYKNISDTCEVIGNIFDNKELLGRNDE